MKKLLCLLTIFALLFSLGACSTNSKEPENEPTVSTTPEYIELASENISEYLSYSWYCNDVTYKPNVVEILYVTTKPRQPGQFFDCSIGIRIHLADGSSHSDYISIPTDGEISEGLESYKIYTHSKVKNVEIFWASGNFYPA